MQDKYPRLYSLSTVCLLKHYNQDYLLHTLRTDFTGSNGVGKSIIADLFQIVFLGDPSFVKFATEGIDAKGRKIEKLPYESGVGYAFFHVEVANRKFITLGSAIYARTHHLITPFVITASMNLQEKKVDEYAFSSDKLPFSRDFLNGDKQPMALAEIAGHFLENRGVCVHHFGTKEGRIEYYEWLYEQAVFPIRLSHESNLKAFANVIQSFSKSKSVNINSSDKLINYLFEDDGAEINGAFQQQEDTIRKLLYEYKIARNQTSQLEKKQTDLFVLKNYNEDKKHKEFRFRHDAYVDAEQKVMETKVKLDKAEAKLQEEKKEKSRVEEKEVWVRQLLPLVEKASKEADRKYNALSASQNLFDELKKLQKEEVLLLAIDLQGLMRQATDQIWLLDKPAEFYHEKIEESRHVLCRYYTVEGMNKQQKKQEEWLQEKLLEVRNAMKSVDNFQASLASVAQNDLFTHSFALHKKLSKPQQAVLLHLWNVLLSKPGQPTPGVRYTETTDLLRDLTIIDDIANNGWWIQTGPLFEFVTASSLQLPDFQKHEFGSIEDVKNYLNQEMSVLEKKRQVYSNLGKGIMEEGFDEFVFDVDLSDATKLKNHTLAAWLCNITDYKIQVLRDQQAATLSKIKRAKEELGIEDEGVDYEELYKKLKDRRDVCSKRFDKLEGYHKMYRSRHEAILNNLPFLDDVVRGEKENYSNALQHFEKRQHSFVSNYTDSPLPAISEGQKIADLRSLEKAAEDANTLYVTSYITLTDKYDETKNYVNVFVNEQLNDQYYSFTILEKALLGNKIGTLDQVTGHLHELNIQLLRIVEELFKSVTKVFAKTESNYDEYKKHIDALNRFFHDKKISNRFHFKIDFQTNPVLDISWIEQLRRTFAQSAASQMHEDLDPRSFIEEFHMRYSKGRKTVSLEDLLNPRKYFVLSVRLTDETNKTIPGSTGESYTALALLAIARLSIVQDGDRPGLRFIILEESATLDNVNFNMFPVIAKEYGYQIITMTPKPYSIGGEEGWYIHQLVPGVGNKDINYPKVMSYFRTNKEQIQLDHYLKRSGHELADM